MNELDKDYQELLQDILDNGVEKSDRTGTGTLSVFGRSIRHKMKDGFPLLTTKKMYFKGIVTELLWFLRGDTNIRYLLDNDCHIWDGDAYKKYLKTGQSEIETEQSQDDSKHWINQELSNIRPYPKDVFIQLIKTNSEFANKWGELGKIYGHSWRNWNDEFGNKGIDQISELIKQLKENPDSRRIMVSAWNASDLPHQVLPPCHYSFQVWTREMSLEERHMLVRKKYLCPKWDFIMDEDNVRPVPNPIPQDVWYDNYNIPRRSISLMFNMRSNDVPLGLPFNIASYALLLEIIGRMVNMVPDEVIANLGDAHIYLNQIDGIKEQLTREPFELPTLKISDAVNFDGTIDEMLQSCTKDCFTIENYQSHPSIKIPLSN